MSTKSFLGLLGVVLVLGGSLGGSFVGGIALGKSQGEEVTPNSAPAQPTASPGQQSSGQSDGDSLNQLRQRIQSGQASPEELAQFRQQFQGQLTEGAGGRGFAGRGGLTGTIENIEGNTVTINTLQGPLQATIVEETTIQRFAVGTLADLLAGVRVTVTDQRGEDGTVEASSILIIPGGAGSLPEGGFFRRDRQQQR